MIWLKPIIGLSQIITCDRVISDRVSECSPSRDYDHKVDGAS